MDLRAHYPPTPPSPRTPDSDLGPLLRSLPSLIPWSPISFGSSLEEYFLQHPLNTPMAAPALPVFAPTSLNPILAVEWQTFRDEVDAY